MLLYDLQWRSGLANGNGQMWLFINEGAIPTNDGGDRRSLSSVKEHSPLHAKLKAGVLNGFNEHSDCPDSTLECTGCGEDPAAKDIIGNKVVVPSLSC